LALSKERAIFQFTSVFAAALILGHNLLAAACLETPKARPAFEFIQQSSPWVRAFPRTGTATLLPRSLDTDLPGVEEGWLQWANRCTAQQCGPTRLGNPVSTAGTDQPRRAFFSTHNSADSCTLAQLNWALGASEGTIDAFSGRGRIRILHETDHVRNTIPIDACVMPSAQLKPHVRRVFLDFEVQDGRWPADTAQFMKEWAKIVHHSGRQAILYTNPLDSPIQRANGLDANTLRSLTSVFDALSVFAVRRPRVGEVKDSIDAQLEILDPACNVKCTRPDHIYVTFSIRRTTLNDAEHVYHTITSHGLRGVILWMDGVGLTEVCQPDLTKKLECLAFGIC
jgi:hypothetical protein